VGNRSPQRSKPKSKNITKELLDEKDERIQHLEEVNRTLKQTNDDLSEELGELRQKLDIVTAEVSF
jgi:predicted RNase H-like nuclease (RuvC/YqgF family)